jgi:hypothetical protein
MRLLLYCSMSWNSQPLVFIRCWKCRLLCSSIFERERTKPYCSTCVAVADFLRPSNAAQLGTSSIDTTGGVAAGSLCSSPPGRCALRSRRCPQSRTNLTECWNGHHISFSWRKAIEPTRYPHSASKQPGHRQIQNQPSRRAGDARLCRHRLSVHRRRHSGGDSDRWPSAFHWHHHQQHHPSQHPAARFATPGRRPDLTSEPAAAEFEEDLWWRTFCSC